MATAVPPPPKLGKEPQSNMDVDYVLVYSFLDDSKSEAQSQYEKLVKTLAHVGLSTEVRQGSHSSLLLFVKVASEDALFGEVYRSRVRDWIHGVRAAEPKKETKAALKDEPLYPAERLRLIYQLITNPTDEGGAGITPKEGQWKNVESIFALHDRHHNKAWIEKWGTTGMLKIEDIDEIRNHLGEKIAYYFAFTQTYFQFLIGPAVFGASAWLILPHYSSLYATVSCLWCVIFVEYWKHQEVDLAIRWGVRKVSCIDHVRRQFKYDEAVTDPVTGETDYKFPAEKRLLRQLLQIPFGLAVAGILGALIAACFGIEVFISEVYDGPLKWVLVYLPTGILTTVQPILIGILTKFAARLTDFENYKTTADHENAMVSKVFIINFICSYLPVFLTAFVYVPFGTLIVPYLDVFHLTVRPFAEHEGQMKAPQHGFSINPDRLRKQVIYLTLTAQLVNQVMEIGLPYIKRRGSSKYKEMQSSYAAKHGGSVPDPSENDAPEEAEFLSRVRQEAELDIYDVESDLREMVLQFGYLSLCSVVWPLTGVSFLINDWIELRTDAIKICIEMQRPTPWRADSIGPWLESLSFLTWLGSLTNAALVYLFANDGIGPAGHPRDITGWGLLLSILFSEHVFMAVRWFVHLAISKLDSPGRVKEQRERYVTRQKFYEESLSQIKPPPDLSSEKSPGTSRSELEDAARQDSLHTSRPEDRFWRHQRGWQETAIVGKDFIDRAAPNETKKGQ